MEDFVVACPLVPNVPHLISGSCSSPRTCAPRFLQTPPHDDALALCLSFGSTFTWTGDFHPLAVQHARHTRGQSLAAAQLCPFAFTQSRSRAAVECSAFVRHRCSLGLEVFRFESCLFGDTRQHSWPYLFAIMKGEDYV